MKKLQHSSESSLFLMEMIMALLFLSLSCAACIQIFAAARSDRIQAEQLNQIQALTTSVGEALEGSGGSSDELLALLPDGSRKNASLIWYYDSLWQNCQEASAAYTMTFTPDDSSSEKSGLLTFRRTSDNRELYKITLSFPVNGDKKEAAQ